MSPTELGVRDAPAAVPGTPPGPDGVASGVRPRGPVVELAGSALAAFAAIWVIFTVAGLSAPFGFLVSWFLLFVVVYGVVCRSLHGILIMKDRLATVAVWAGSLTALVALVAVIGFVVFKGAPVVFAHFPHFLTADMSQAGGIAPVTDTGAGAAIMGTLEQVGIATLLTVPLAILTATYLVHSNSLLSRIVRNVVDAMTGTPSIIAGIFLYILLVKPRGVHGPSGVAAALALSVLMLPLVTRAALEVIIIVPGALREAALALGSPQWRVVLRVVLPTARVGLITAAILGVARTAGETAEVLFTAGGNSHYNLNPVSGFQDDLPLRIYELINQPSLNAIREAWGIAFVLVAVVLSLFATARFVGSAGNRGFLKGLRQGKAWTDR
jgi:phosphate transport system permease protein